MLNELARLGVTEGGPGTAGSCAHARCRPGGASAGLPPSSILCRLRRRRCRLPFSDGSSGGVPLQKMPALLLCMSSLCSEYACHASSASSAGSEEMFLQGLSNENAGHAVRVMLPCQHQDHKSVHW